MTQKKKKKEDDKNLREKAIVTNQREILGRPEKIYQAV